MSDFDTVLERLLLDPQFKSSLARDAARTLAGYQLSDEERQILLSDLTSASGTQSLVEDRISKSSMFGLLSSLSGGLANVTEYEEVARGGPGADGDAVAIKEVDPMPVPHVADSPGSGGPADGGSLKGGPSPHMVGGADVNGDAVAIKEVDPMPVPHVADSPGSGGPADGGSLKGGPSPHMAGDPTPPSSDGGETRVGPTEAKISPAEAKISDAGLHAVISPDLPSS